MRRRRDGQSDDGRRCEAPHRRRSLWPMKSDVDFTFGFSCSMVATGTPVFAEMTANVSPARTVQNRGRAAVVVVAAEVVVGRRRAFRFVVVVARCCVVVRPAAVVPVPVPE